MCNPRVTYRTVPKLDQTLAALADGLAGNSCVVGPASRAAPASLPAGLQSAGPSVQKDSKGYEGGWNLVLPGTHREPRQPEIVGGRPATIDTRSNSRQGENQ